MWMINITRFWVEKLLEIFTVCLLIGLTSIVLAAVLFRAFDSSLIWYDEVASVGLAWLTFYGANLAALKRAHMGFPGIISHSPLPIRIPLFIFSELIVISFFALVAYYGYQVMEILAWDALVSLPSVSLTLTQSAVPISASLFILCELLSLPGAWKKMCAGVDTEHEAIEEAIRLAEEELKEAKA
ncbi:TRAP transporter small permease [Nitrincola iocasae]|uniref:TRAP transporter small permease n=1 Tax=Nitrincola iocasae TaxID=2614693 RepID=UPI001CD92B51|nr:TRAP transporter small permease subunit [Nitrincola iocasae]